MGGDFQKKRCHGSGNSMRHKWFDAGRILWGNIITDLPYSWTLH